MGGEAYFTNVMASNLVISLSDFYKGSETSEGGCATGYILEYFV